MKNLLIETNAGYQIWLVKNDNFIIFNEYDLQQLGLEANILTLKEIGNYEEVLENNDSDKFEIYKLSEQDFNLNLKIIFEYDFHKIIKKFIVISDVKKGTANFDTYSGDFETLEKANNHAAMLWDHLTKKEKENRTVNVYHVTLDDIEDEFKKDVTCFSWGAFYQSHQEENYFNSEKLESIK